eukprot:Sdes_comp17705_c0_seq1m6977
MKVLYFSDPQIVGNLWENQRFKISTQWDCDDYLTKNFHLAVKTLSPDIIFVLGDIIDEFSETAKNLHSPQFHVHQQAAETLETYKARIDSIFEIATQRDIPLYFLPGDNDIGGENLEPVYDAAVDVFEKYFGTVNSISAFGKFTFVKVNSISLWNHNADGSHHSAAAKIFLQRSAFKSQPILLSHLPLYELPEDIQSLLLQSVSPSMIFSAHTHTFSNHSYTSHAKTIQELTVPTMSYRMGTLRMGFVSSVVCKDLHGELLFHNRFHSFPSRFEIIASKYINKIICFP